MLTIMIHTSSTTYKDILLKLTLGLCKSVWSIIVENARRNAASDDLNGLPGPKSRNSFFEKDSMIRSMHWASPGRRKCPRNKRSAFTKLASGSALKWNVSTYSRNTSAWNGYLSTGPRPKYSPIWVFPNPGAFFRN